MIRVAHCPLLLLTALLPTWVAPAAAQIADDPAVKEALRVAEVWLDAQMAYEEIPAVSVAVVHDQELVWSRAAGMAHPEEGAPATRETLYSICSISKLFTSIAVMQLRDRGALSLRDRVADLLPWYAVEQRHPGSPPVTVEGILTHSAGLPRETAQPYWTGPDFPFPTREEIIAGLDEQETLYPARAYFQYSNLGLALAGQIVEEHSGMPYDAYVRSNILEPLGLSNTFPEIPEEHRGERFATGYGSHTREGGREEVEFFQARGIAPAAGYASTAEDLARFASWQFDLTGDREHVLHAHTLDEMHRVHYVDPDFERFWGLGFSISRRDDRTFIGHGGSCPGFRSHLRMQKDERIATIFMANAMVSSGSYTGALYDLVRDAIVDAADAGHGDDDADRHAPHHMAHHGGADDTNLDDYLGTYSEQPWGSERAVVQWHGGLALLRLPTDDPVESMQELGHDEGDVFYLIRSDGTRGHDVIFHRGDDGRVVSYSEHGNFSPRVADPPDFGNDRR